LSDTHELGNLRYFEAARDIRVPDGSRLVFDNGEKLEALEIIHDEAVSLVEALYRDIESSSVERYKPEPLRKINIYLLLSDLEGSQAADFIRWPPRNGKTLSFAG